MLATNEKTQMTVDRYVRKLSVRLMREDADESDGPK